MPAPLVAVTFILYDYSGHADVVLRVSNLALSGVSASTPPVTVDPAAHVQIETGLITPVEIGSRIDFNAPAGPGKLVPNGGSIRFLLNDTLRPYLGYRWIGTQFEIRTGNEGDAFNAMTIAYVGMVATMTHDGYVCSVQTTDRRLLLDKPVVNTFYPDDALPAIAGKPYPHLYGKKLGIEPVLEDEAAQRYRITDTASGSALTITELRVGGVPWDYVGSNPAPGQYTYGVPSGVDLGAFELGGIPGGEIRVDAYTSLTLTTAGLLRELATQSGFGTLAGEEAALDVLAPWTIGYWLGTTPVNYQDVMDDVAGRQLCWWGADDTTGFMRMGRLQNPDTTTKQLTTLDIGDVKQQALTPNAWRVTVEHSPNQAPASQFFDSVPTDLQQQYSATGITAPAYDGTVLFPDILTISPQAVDLPTIHSLVNSEIDALAIRDLAFNLWSNTGFPMDVEVERSDLAIGDSVGLDYLGLPVYVWGTPGSYGNFRVYGLLRRFGGDRPSVVQLRNAPPLSANSGS